MVVWQTKAKRVCVSVCGVFMMRKRIMLVHTKCHSNKGMKVQVGEKNLTEKWPRLGSSDRQRAPRCPSLFCKHFNKLYLVSDTVAA